MPDGTQVTSGMNVQGIVEDGVLKTMSDKELGFELAFGDGKTVYKAGFLSENLKYAKFQHKIMSKDGTLSGNLGLKFDKVILFDKDGDKNTKEDRIVLDGELSVDDIQPVFGCEWKEKLPDQFIATLGYSEKVDIKATFGGELGSVKSMLKSVGVEGYKNETVFGKTLKLSGVDMSDKLVIGAVGLRMGTGVTIGKIKTIKEKSEIMPLNPILLLTFYVELDGTLKVNASIEFESQSYVKKGINIQKAGFKGAFGSCEDNKGNISEEIFGYQVDVYDMKVKSENAVNEKPETTVTIAAEGTMEGKAGAGVGLGIMTYGIIPAYVNGSVCLEAQAEIKGSVKVHAPYAGDNADEEDTPAFMDALDAEGRVHASMQANAVADAAVRLNFKLVESQDEEKDNGKQVDQTDGKKDEKTLLEGGFKWKLKDPLKYTLAEWQFSLTQVKGKVIDKESKEPVAGATVLLQKKNTDDFSNAKYRKAVTDENGEFVLKNCADGTYVLCTQKDDYTEYKNENFKIDEKLKEQEITLEKENAEELFYQYIDDTLEPQYQLAKETQTGTQRKYEDKWLDPVGIFSAQIYDLDQDGKQEMLLVRADKKVWRNQHTVKMEIYEIENGEVVLADQCNYAADVTNNDAYSYGFNKNEVYKKLYNVSLVNADKQLYIVCEMQMFCCAFGDGAGQNYWIMRYKDGKLQHVSSFAQIGEGSSAFEYSEYTFKNGKKVKEELLYSWWEDENPTYGTDYKAALTSVFSKYGIILADTIGGEYGDGRSFESILSGRNDLVRVMQYQTKCTDSNYKTNTYKFQATLSDYTGLRTKLKEYKAK